MQSRNQLRVSGISNKPVTGWWRYFVCPVPVACTSARVESGASRSLGWRQCPAGTRLSRWNKGNSTSVPLRGDKAATGRQVIDKILTRKLLDCSFFMKNVRLASWLADKKGKNSKALSFLVNWERGPLTLMMSDRMGRHRPPRRLLPAFPNLALAGRIGGACALSRLLVLLEPVAKG